MSDYFKGVTFPWQEVTPSDDAIVRRAILPDRCLSGCELTYSGYTLTMAAGSMIVCGRQFKHTAAQNWAITGATSGYARLLLAIDVTKASTEDAFEQIVTSIEYASAVNGFSVLRQDDINGTGTIYQVGICVVALGTGGIARIVSSLTRGNLGSDDVGAVPTTRKVNGKALSADITLSASDVGAAPVDSVGTNKVFKKLTDIGITAFPTTMSIVASKMPNNSTLILDSRDIVSGGANEISDLGVVNAGTYIIMRGNTTSRVQLLHIYGSASGETSFIQVGNYAVTPNIVSWVRALDNSDSNYGTASANNGYHTAYFTRIGRFASCTLLPQTTNATPVYSEDIIIPSGYYPAEQATFNIYSDVSKNAGGDGSALVRVYTNGVLRVYATHGISVAESSKTYCWVTA